MSSKAKIAFMILIIATGIILLSIGIWLGTRSTNICSSVSTPANLTIENMDQNVFVTWIASDKAYVCNITYIVEYSMDESSITHQKYTTGLSYEFSISDFCTAVYVKVYALDELNEEMSDAISDEYIVIPSNIDAVNGLNFIDSRTVTWVKPSGYDNCNLTYNVIVSSDITASEEFATDEPIFVISDGIYCFNVTISVAAVIDDVTGQINSESKNFGLDAPSSLTAIPSESTLIVTWDPLDKEIVCNISYILTYETNNDPPIDVRVQTNTYTLDLAYCANTKVNVISISGKYVSTQSECKYEAEYPTDSLPSPTNAVFNEVEADIILSWDSVLSKCSAASYTVELMSDKISTAVTYIASTLNYTIPNTFEYCFLLVGEITASLEDLKSDSIRTQYIFDLEAPQDLIAQVSTNGDKMEVSWTPDSRQAQCNIGYMVKYQIGQHDKKTIEEIDTSSVSLPLKYCLAYNIDVVALSTEYQKTSTSTIALDEVYPEFIGTVENVQVTLSETTVNVTWTKPTGNLYHCEISYTIIANADEYVSSYTTGPITDSTASCFIIIPSTCPATSVFIVPRTPDVTGEVYSITLDCPTETVSVV